MQCRATRDYFSAFGAARLMERIQSEPGTCPVDAAELALDDSQLRVMLDATRLLVCLLRDRTLHLQKVMFCYGINARCTTCMRCPPRLEQTRRAAARGSHSPVGMKASNSLRCSQHLDIALSLGVNVLRMTTRQCDRAILASCFAFRITAACCTKSDKVFVRTG